MHASLGGSDNDDDDQIDCDYNQSMSFAEFCIASAASRREKIASMNYVKHVPRTTIQRLAAESRPWPFGNAGSKNPTQSDVNLLSTTKNDCLLRLADFIAPMVVQFLGVRSLISFGATGKSQRMTIVNEVKRRKAYIADIEVEVTRLMALAKQSTKLSEYINDHLNWFNEEGIQAGWPAELEDGDPRLHENEELEVSNLSYNNFIEAKILVYNAMRLIDDEIGIFHKTLVTEDEGTEYYNIWEDVHFASETRHGIELPFSNIPFSEMDFPLCESGDKICIFFNERRKFFSFVKNFTVYGDPPRFMQAAYCENKCPVGSLFLLPACFYFSPEGESSRMSSEAIQIAINRVERFVGNYSCGLLSPDTYDDDEFNNFIEQEIRAIVYEDNIDAFRIVSREFLCNHGCGFMKALLWKMIKLVDIMSSPTWSDAANTETFNCSYVTDYY
jgi:hypothetical protein